MDVNIVLFFLCISMLFREKNSPIKQIINQFSVLIIYGMDFSILMMKLIITRPLKVSRLFNLKIKNYVTLDNHFSNYSNCCRSFWLLWNSSRCRFYCKNSILHIYCTIYFIINIWTAFVRKCRYLKRGKSHIRG